MMSERAKRMYDEIVECGIATPDELNLAFNMTGNDWEWTLDMVVYIRTGYQSYNDWIESEDE